LFVFFFFVFDGLMQVWTLLDCHFGIPLFDVYANNKICDMVVSGGLAEAKRYITLHYVSILFIFFQFRKSGRVESKVGVCFAGFHLSVPSKCSQKNHKTDFFSFFLQYNKYVIGEYYNCHLKSLKMLRFVLPARNSWHFDYIRADSSC